MRKWLHGGRWLSLPVLALSLLVTCGLWQDARQNAERAFLADFDFRIRDSNMRIEQRIKIYEQALRGAAGLFAASDSVTRESFHAYVNTLDLAENYPGIQGVGFSLVVPPRQKNKHVAAVRQEGFPDYAIRPEGARDVYSSIVYLEPFSGLNLRAFGYDMYSEPVRRAAMERARDSGSAAVSGKVTLVQEIGSNAQAGFLMYLPVYRKGASIGTLTERRDNLLGWVYAPFRMNDFMAGISGEQAAYLSIRVYDGWHVSDDALMYASHPGSAVANTDYKAVASIDIGSHDWTIVTAATPDFEGRMDRDKPLLVLKSGIGVGLLLTLLTWVFLDDRERALRAARQAIQLALYDVLTGLPNRKLITDRLQQSLANAGRNRTRVALMFIDLDKFKPVNDNFGHAVGDLLLQEVAMRLRHCVRTSDTVSRLGGDEFVVLLPNIDNRDGVTMVAEKILHALTQPYELVGQRFHISASIGIALYPEDGGDEKTLLKSADRAMYQAKNSGRNNLKYFKRELQAEPT
jgi:diguanylate cyclase (GGDEF)-like protein